MGFILPVSVENRRSATEQKKEINEDWIWENGLLVSIDPYHHSVHRPIRGTLLDPKKHVEI